MSHKKLVAWKKSKPKEWIKLYKLKENLFTKTIKRRCIGNNWRQNVELHPLYRIHNEEIRLKSNNLILILAKIHTNYNYNFFFEDFY